MASGLESVQFEVMLTKDKRILGQLRKNKLERVDAIGPYFSIQFDSKEFKFRPGVTFTVGKTIGHALIRSSAVLLGEDPLSDDFVPFVEKVSQHELGQPEPKKPQFACPICKIDQKSAPKLARHLMDKKAHEETELEIGQTKSEFDNVDGAEDAEELAESVETGE